MPKKRSIPAEQNDDLARVRRYQRIIVDLSRLAAADPQIDDFLRQVVHQVGRAVDIDRIKILRYRPRHGDLLVEAGVGWKEGVIGKATLPVGLTSPPGRAIQTGRSNVIEDLPASGDYKLSGLLKEHGIVSLINSPIVVEGLVWGVLEADSQEARRFSKDTEDFMETVAHLVGAAVQRRQIDAKAIEAKAETARRLAGRETLLREMQHRSKNNYQMIISMILLQKSRAETKETRKVLKVLSDRITAMAMAQDQLDPREGLRMVNLAHYLGALCRQMADFVEGVSIDTDLDLAEAPIDTAVPLGLIVNELVTNAIKHAFDGPGTVRVEFRAGEAIRESCLSVIDNGKGMGPPRPGSSGTRLLESLATQLRGRIEYEAPGRGTVVRVCFPPTDSTP